MQTRLILILVFLCQIQLGTSQFTDSFSDGELNNNPTWIYQSGDFEVNTGKLRSKNSVGGTVFYGISSVANTLNSEWFSIDIELQANPSSANYIDYFIAADTLAEYATNGYFIRFGDLKDEISFYKLNNGSKTELISGVDGELNKSSNSYSIFLSKTANFNWELSYINNANGVKSIVGTIQDSSFKSGKYTGIKIAQNGTTIIGKHYFDNLFSGLKPIDTTGPHITKVQSIIPDTILLEFNEELGNISSSIFTLNNSIISNSAIVSTTNPKQLSLVFTGNILVNKKYILTIQNIQDTSGNITKNDTALFNTYQFVSPQRDDIIITEIMAKPTPTLGVLAETEYIEILNRSNKFLILKNCVLKDITTTVNLPDSVLFPGEFAIISKSNSPRPSNSKWIPTSTFPTLNDDGDEIELLSPDKKIISSVSYSENWHNNTLKKSGGWSLEMIDTSKYCVQHGNWSSNNSNGGTPGKANSIFGFIQTANNKISRIYCNSSNTIQVYFLNNPDSFSSTNIANYQVDELGINPTKAELLFQNGQPVCEISFNVNFIADNIYHLNVSNISSCYGSTIAQNKLEFGYGTNTIDSGDLRINEILFDPIDDESDYIEIVNTTDKIIDLKYALIANKDKSGILENAYIIAPEGYHIFPGKYALLTIKPDLTAQRYPQNNSDVFITMKTLPTYSNEEGHAAIISPFAATIDEFIYNDNMHSPLISNPNGVSLEKSSPQAPSNDASFWFSSVENAGFGTPGIPNSQLIGTVHSKKHFSIDKPYFSPDGNGDKDLLPIQYSLPNSGYFLTAKIFNETGGEMGTLFSNYGLQQNGYIVWNGEINDAIVPTGNYVIFLEAFNEKGSIIQQKITVSVVRMQ